jgi:hypothetical protein
MVMKSSVFWDITPCSPLKVNRRFGETCHVFSSAYHLLSGWFLAWLMFQPRRWRQHVPPKRRLTFSGLHGAKSQKIEFFIVIIVLKLLFSNYPRSRSVSIVSSLLFFTAVYHLKIFLSRLQNVGYWEVLKILHDASFLLFDAVFVE